MVFCCFGGKPSAAEVRHGANISPKTSTGPTEVAEGAACAASNPRQDHLPANDTLSGLRCQLATVQGSWLVRVHACVENVLTACGPAVAQVSLFGASPCGTVFVTLGSASASPPAGLLSPGLVLSAPWLGCGGGATGGGTHSANANAERSSNSGGLVILGSARACGSQGGRTPEVDVLVWQEPPPMDSRARTQTEVPIPIAAPKSDGGGRQPPLDAPLAPPEDWRKVLRAIGSDLAVVAAAAAAAAATPTANALPNPAVGDHPLVAVPLRAHLVPLRLGADVIGALLLTTTATPPPPAQRAATAALRRLEAPLSREMLTGVAAAVAECCMGPHMGDIQRVTLASSEVAAAPDLQGLASSLSAALTDSLVSELHVDFGVRLALVPYAPGVRGNPQFGFLLTEQAQPAAAAATALGQPHFSQGAVASGELSSMGATPGPASRNATRSLTQQSFAERVLASKLGSIPTMATALALDPLSGAFAHTGAAGAPAVAFSGNNSFMLPGAAGQKSGQGLASRVWKARPFSLESTLLALLLRKASKAGHGTGITMYGMTTPTGPVTPSATAGPGSGLGLPSVYVAMTALSTLEDAGLPSNVPSPNPRTAAAAAAGLAGGYGHFMAVGSLLTGPSYGCVSGVGGAGGFRVGRMGGMVVPHVHAYVNDTDQPSGDVVLLLRTAAAATAGGRGGGGGGHPALGSGLSVVTASAGGAGGAGPASMVLVMGSVSLPTVDMHRGGGTAAAAEGTAGGGGADQPPGRNVTGNGMMVPGGSCASGPPSALRTRNSIGGAGAGGSAGGGGGGLDVCVALYLTCQERLPASLLCAARIKVQVLLELLLPAAGACLSEHASAELQYLCDAVSGSAGATAPVSGLLGRVSSVPISRLHPRVPDDPGGSGSSNVLQLQPGQGQQQLPSLTLAANGAVMAPVDALAGGLLPLPLASGSTGGQGAGVSNTISASLSLRGCGLREIAAAAGSAALGSPGAAAAAAAAAATTAAAATAAAAAEGPDQDGSALAQLLMTRVTNTALMTGPESATTLLGSTTLTGVGQATRDASEVAVRVPRSRLSNATATASATATPTTTTTGHVPPGGTGTGYNALANAFTTSYNSLLSAFMGSGSVTGKATGAGAGSGIDGTATGADMGYGSAASTPGGSSSAAPAVPLGAPSPSIQQGLQRRTMLLLQQHQHTQQHQQQLVHMMQRTSATSSIFNGRSMPHVRAHLPPRRQVSDLLATMPWDVSDTLTVMRTNMDILVSSFWNTLRSQNTEAAPSPYADEDLRFLRLFKVIGGGGCATVYAGLLHGLEVGVKVMKAQGPEGGGGEGGGGEGGDGERRRQRQDQGQDGDLGGQADDDSAPLRPGSARQAQMRAIMRGARELAVMTSISHPNIVQIYSYHTRVLVKFDAEDGPGAGGASGGGGRHSAAAAPPPPSGAMLPRLIPVAENPLGNAPGPLQTVLIMECCDLGSLADALDSGMFAQAIRNAESMRWRAGPRRSQTMSLLGTIPAEASITYGSGDGGASGSGRGAIAAGGSAMRAIYLTLLEVALALRHMHSMQLVHCDVKPANVLLRSSASDPRGFTCKLTDFGFVNLLQYHVDDADDPQARPSMRYHEPVGTVTHLAPETMVQGSKLDHTVDIFAFGILMWEVYTGRAPYAEHATNNFRDVPYRVVREGLRPTFPASTPLAFKSLAQACWSADASKRPTAAVLVASLQRLMDAAARG